MGGGRRRTAFAVLTALLLSTCPVGAQSPNDDLFKAVELNDIAAVEAAIKAGAQLAATNKNGMTAADLAVDLGHFRIAHTLLAYRNGGTQVGPRVTDKGRQALSEPSKRIMPAQKAAPAAPAATEGPDPRLANIVPPRKPVDVPALPATPRETPPTATVQAPAPAAKPMPAQQPAPAPSVEPRKEDSLAALQQEERDEGGGFLSSVMSGVHSIVTLGGLIGGSEAPKQSAEQLRKKLPSPADRFSAPAPAQSSDTAAGRMVDRLTNSVAGGKQAENEFGLPTSPVLPPLQAPDAGAPLEAPGLAPPVMPGAPATAEATLPPLAMPEAMPGLDIPGIAPPVETAQRSEAAPSLPALGAPEVAAPALPAPAQTGGDVGIEIPGLAEPIETPAAKTPRTAAKKAPSAPARQLPPGLELPGLAAPTDEVPGIIPPPLASNELMPALPPGLEPLPGSSTGLLRRPGGLVEPKDTSTLPPPGGDDIRSRLQRLDDILKRGPGEVTDRYKTGVGTAPTEPRTPSAAPRTPVTPGRPTSETVPGTAPPIAASRPDIRDPAEILRQSRESARMRTQLEASARPRPNLGIDMPARTKVETPHALKPPPTVVTERPDSTSRMMDRLNGITKQQYPHDDVYGLPVNRPPVAGEPMQRKDVDVTELADVKTKKVDDRIFKLARFFRGDQEQESGMQPPKPSEVEASPLPQVIDNMLPENDPARKRVVDDKLLDLTGVEKDPPAYRGQAGATQTGDSLNTNFLDKLGKVLGPNRDVRSVEQPMPEPGKIGLNELDIPSDQARPDATPKLPDPWTMTIEKSEADGQKRTLGVTAVSPTDGSEIKGDQGVVTKMVGRIRELLGGPEGARGPDVAKLDAAERQQTAEQLLSEALRDGAPAALPDQNQWPVTEVEAGNAVPGVPPAPRPGVLSRTSLTDVVLSMGQSVTLENTLPPQQEGVDPLNECVKKNHGTTLFCIEPIDWPENLKAGFVVPTILYTGPMAITRYDQGTPTRFHALFDSEKFEEIVAYYQARYGEPTEIWKRSIAPLAKPREDNPTLAWRSRDSKTNVITVLEIRKYDDSRGGFPDIQRGAVMLYHLNAPQIFPQVSSHELMRLRRTR